MSHNHSHHGAHVPDVQGEPIQERVLLKSGPLWASGIGLATLIIVAMGLMRAFQLALNHGQPIVTANEAQEQLSLIKRMAPLDANQRAARVKYDDEQQRLLNEYSWIDQKQHLARIPIQRAMSLTVQKYGKAE